MMGVWSGYVGGGAKLHLRFCMQGQVGDPYPLVLLGLPEHRPSQISGKYSDFQVG